MKYQRWVYGAFRVILNSGAEFTFEGRLRFERDLDGFVTAWEVDGDLVIIFPNLDEVAAILTVPEVLDA